MLGAFTHHSPTFTVHWQRGIVEGLDGLLSQLGARRALLVCGPSMAATRLVDAAVDGSGGAITAVFSGVLPHLPMGLVDDMASVYRAGGHDALVALGGSSTIDAMRAVALCLATGRNIAEHFSPGGGPSYFYQGDRHDTLLIAIPTTFSSSEVTYGAAVTNEDDARKYVVAGRALYADHVVLDPTAFETTPLPILISTGLCAVNHGVERMVSPAYQRLAGTTLGAALDLLFPALTTLAGDVGRRRAEALEACMAGAHLSTSMNIMSGATHAIAHVLGARLRVSHGQAHGVMLPFVGHFVDPHDGGARARLARCCQVITPGPEAPSSVLECHEALRGYVASLGMPTRLRQLGISADALPDIAAAACQDLSAAHSASGMQGPESVLAVLREAW